MDTAANAQLSDIAATPPDGGQMRATECRQCFLCGADGHLLHRNLKDRLFHVPGTWNSRKCMNEECGLVWLDPMPIPEDIHLAYATYYTHADKAAKGPQGRKKGLDIRLLRIYKSILKMILGQRREAMEHYLMYLQGVPPGRLLEIGCGSGKRLSRLAALGWQVEGQEVDEKAWNAARASYPFEVHLGELHALGLTADSYDAVVMNHVIEHVHAPVELLGEIRRLLKPGGQLVVATPNAASQEHGAFGSDWYSLDPPRHLHIYTPRALAHLARLAGFEKCETWTTSVNSDYVAAASLKICGLGDMKAAEEPLAKERRNVAGLYFQLWAAASQATRPDRGEECALRAFK
jgi:2-polyprenyl-3-methyl-5-hydroxy-6-metoxy-1,4-benzoquinol methylase